MTTTRSAPLPDLGPAEVAPTPDRTAQRVPARRLSPSPQKDRPLRLLITVLGAIVLVLVLVGLAAVSVSSWYSARGFSDVPATTELGSPATLTLDSDIGEIRVLRSPDVSQVTLALVKDGSTALPSPGTVARASITQQGEDASRTVQVRQPTGPTAGPWEQEHHDLLLMIPADHQLALRIDSSYGDIDADGSFTSIDVRAEVGDIRLTSVTAPDGLTVDANLGDVEIELEGPTPEALEVTSSLGDVDVLLPVDARGDVDIRSEMGDIDLVAPGSGRWAVDAQSELGSRTVDPALSNASGEILGSLTVRSEIGNVTVSR